MQRRKRITRSIILAAALGTTISMAHAQPGQNAGNNAAGGQGNGQPNWQNMKPEERMKMILGFMENGVRQQMKDAGIAKNVQDAAIQHWRSQEEARQDIRTKTGELFDALRGKDATDEELEIMMRDLTDAVAQEKTRHEQAIKDLDAQINFSKNLRLKALLTVLGLIGDEAAYTNISGMSGLMFGRGGMGAPGAPRGPGGAAR